MWSVDHREAIENCLGRIGVAGCEIEDRVAGLTLIAFEYRCRRDRRNKSSPIAKVLDQLAILERAARRACAGRTIETPAAILPETIGALIGRYPFSNLDLAPVTMETLAKRHGAGDFRTAVVDATVERHVVDAALRQLPGTPHLVAARAVPFPYAAARAYFFPDGLVPTEAELKGCLEQFIVGGPDVALEFIQVVHERVRRTTRDPARQNPGRRSLYDWAEPSPVARLVFDVCGVVLDDMVERPEKPVRSALIELMELLVGKSVDVRQDTFSSMLTIWVALRQHECVDRRLSAILNHQTDSGAAHHDGLEESDWLGRRFRRRRSLLIRCQDAIAESAAELLRRGHMGDFQHLSYTHGRGSVQQHGRTARTNGFPTATKRRATGVPTRTIDMAGIVELSPDVRFLGALARVCKPWTK